MKVRVLFTGWCWNQMQGCPHLPLCEPTQQEYSEYAGQSHQLLWYVHSRKIRFFFPVSSIKLRRVLWVTNTAWVKAVRHWLLATKTQLMTWVATNLIHPASFSVAFCMKGLSWNLNGMGYLHTRPVKTTSCGLFQLSIFSYTVSICY